MIVVFAVPISLFILQVGRLKMFNATLDFNPFDKSHSAFGTVAQIKLRDKFLNSFGDRQIFCYNGDPRKKISSMKHTSDLNEAITANHNNADVYFYVNGGRKQYAIEEVRACFVDMDAGRDHNNHYLKAREVLEIKKKFLDKINSFSVKPTWVVDTRNGYQVYWVLNPYSRKTTNPTYWNGIQKKLANYFDGDVRAIKINQIYRVPFTWWRKPWENKQSYFTSILPNSTQLPVYIDDLKYALEGVSAVVEVINTKTSEHWFEEHRKKALAKDATAGVNEKAFAEYANHETPTKAYGVPHPVSHSNFKEERSDAQTKLLKTVVEFLNQASTSLYFSNNRFLASSAKDLAAQISDKFCIG